MATNSSEIRIVRADPSKHAAAVVELIKELAEFEHMLDQYKPVPLELHLNQQRCHCFVALSDSEAVIGFAIYYYAYSTWEGPYVFMEDLYVQPEHRGNGVGIALWKRVAQVCIEEHCTRLEWNVLNWNKKAIEFYKKQGATDLKEAEGWIRYRLTQENIHKLAKN